MWYCILLATGGIELFICFYALIRNQWVYDNRMKLLEEDYSTYKKLPSYSDMLEGHGFWQWDIRKYS